MTCFCKELENSLRKIHSMIRDVHNAIELYVDKPVYGRFLGELDKKHDKFMSVLDSVDAEAKKVGIFENEIAAWSEGTLSLIWKDQFKTNSGKIKSIKETI